MCADQAQPGFVKKLGRPSGSGSRVFRCRAAVRLCLDDALHYRRDRIAAAELPPLRIEQLIISPPAYETNSERRQKNTCHVRKSDNGVGPRHLREQLLVRAGGSNFRNLSGGGYEWLGLELLGVKGLKN